MTQVPAIQVAGTIKSYGENSLTVESVPDPDQREVVLDVAAFGFVPGAAPSWGPA